MSKKKQIKASEWQERLQTFTSGNRGRRAAIAVEGMTLVENKPFERVVYDPVGKGNDLVISVEDFSHTVSAPAEMYMEENDKGVVTSLDVIDQNGQSSFLRFY